MNRRQRFRFAAGFAVAISPVFAMSTFAVLDWLYPLNMPRELAVSTEVVDRNGQLLRPFATPEGRWRLPVRLADVDPQFVAMLIAYEDKRFYQHIGVDGLAIGRAALQFIKNGKIVSGGSTLSMQLARLNEQVAPRSLPLKLKQMFRALQIERSFTKKQILERYLTQAPYGGNLEGVRAASLAYFGKEPRKLMLQEAALLVALPQSPEARRPDRKADNAQSARNRVLQRMAEAGAIEPREVARAAALALETGRRGLPALAPHLAETAFAGAKGQQRLALTLSKASQQALETVARDAARRLGANLSVAMILADSRTGEILADIGSAHYFDGARSGWVDMSRAPRSPGSTLKPFIFALAFDEGIVAAETLISDRPVNFGGYRPRNFDTTYQGDVTVRQALQMSLNVPAVLLLDSVGPARLIQRFRQAGLHPEFPKVEQPGLAIGLGGVGLSLADLVQAYAMLANGGMKMTLHNGIDRNKLGLPPFWQKPERILSAQAAWQVTDILSGVAPPANAAPRRLAYKTGTSYGYRDAWSIGYDGRYVLGVWVGRADNGAVPGATGGGTAAPVLFEAFARSGLESVPFRPAPAGTKAVAEAGLAQSLKRFVARTSQLVPLSGETAAPEIVFPPKGARVELATGADGQPSPLVLKVQGGKAPFRWIANGTPVAALSRRRNMAWQPDGAGYSSLTVIDASGKAASVDVFLVNAFLQAK
jgi:penicillin-binding protein 1C